MTGLSEWPDVLGPLLVGAAVEADIVTIEPLTGGVSSDIVKIELSDGSKLCAKRALPTLKVAALWEAPVERNHYEVAWLRQAAMVSPTSVPRVLAEDKANGVLLMQFFDPEHYRLWKTELLAGRSDIEVATKVAEVLGRIHAATWSNESVRQAFAIDSLFDALRLDPYLRSLIVKHPELRDRLTYVIGRTANSKLALVHGDVSPKNILISNDDGHPVFLDAECAWFGDPSFDAAFCVNHLFLKAFHIPRARQSLLSAARRFLDVWLKQLPETGKGEAESRFLGLLPCLLLARVDGKSPVEYLDENTRNTVRAYAMPLILRPAASLEEMVDGVRSPQENKAVL